MSTLAIFILHVPVKFFFMSSKMTTVIYNVFEAYIGSDRRPPTPIQREEATKESGPPIGGGDPREDQGPGNLTFSDTKQSIKDTDSDICRLVTCANTKG